MDFGGFRAVRAPFDKDGKIAALGPIDGSHVHEQLAALVPQIDDLIVISHGWNNNVPEAQALYDEFLGNVRAQWAAAGLEQHDADRTGVLALYWPSKRFEESDLISGGAASVDDTSTGGPGAAAVDYQAKIEEQVANLRDADGQFPPEQQALLEEIAQTSRSLDDPASQTAFVVALAKLMPAPAEPDPGLDVLTVQDAQANGPAILQEVATQVGGGTFVAPPPDGEGGAASIGDASTAPSDMSGGAAGFDPLGGIKKAAWLMLNLTTYYAMKERAGTLGPIAAKLVLDALKQKPSLRVHLVGHSFGGRLVTSLANALPDGGPSVASMMLLQAAYSHYGLAPAPSAGQAARPAGAFRSVVEKRKVRGWIQITHSNHDWAVGAGYPLASSIARQTASALELTVPSTADSLWGGMGANGAQQTPETYDTDMLASEGRYPPPGAKLPHPKRTIRNINGNAFISGHGAVRGKQVTWAFLQGFVAARA